MSKKHTKVFMTSNFMEHLLILHSTINGIVSSFASLVDISIDIVGSAVEFKIGTIIAKIKTSEVNN